MIVFGKNVVYELLENNTPIKKCFLFKNFSDKKLISELKKRNIEIKYKGKDELDRLIKGNHQGIIVEIDEYQFSSLEAIMNQDNQFIVVLDHLEDPHNFGSIIRTCECAGVDGIIIPKNRSIGVNSTVMKVSAGALPHVKIVEVSNINRAIETLKDSGYWIVGADMAGDDYSTLNYEGPIALVIGSEGFGIKDLTKKSCDFLAAIPMKGKINSLNASVSAGILIFEIAKTRK